MKNYNKILEAINRGINLALDDFDDLNLIGQQTLTIKDQNRTIDYITFTDNINKILTDDISLPRKLDLIKAYKEIVEIHDRCGFTYKVSTLEELKFVIEKFIKIWPVTTNNFNWIDVSSLTSLKYAFSIPSIRNNIGVVVIDEWNIHNVKDISFMAWNCKYFNAYLGTWDVSNVELAGGAFLGCNGFNSDLSNWNVSKLQDAGSMFLYCHNFNSDLSNWNVSNLVVASLMFKECYSFNSDLSNWDVSNVQNANMMFLHCSQFKLDLSKWNLAKCNNGNRGQWFRQIFEYTPMEYEYDLFPPKLITPMMKK